MEGDVGRRRELGLFEVDLDDGRAVGLRASRQPCRGVHLSRCADDDTHIAPPGEFLRGEEIGRGKRLAEEDHVRSHRIHALAADRRPFIRRDDLQALGFSARQTPGPPEASVQLDDLARVRGLMQPVDVLGDHNERFVALDPARAGEYVMGRVGTRFPDHSAAIIEPVPQQRQVVFDQSRRGELVERHAAPHVSAAAAPEGRDSRFRGDSRARQDQHSLCIAKRRYRGLEFFGVIHIT